MKKIKGTPAGIVEIIRKMVADSTCDHDWFLDCEILFVATVKGGMRLNHKSLYALLRELYRAGKIQHTQEKNRHWFRLRTALTGLGWHATTASGGMFFDDRIPYRKGQPSNVVAWLNHKNGVFSVNVVSDTFTLTHPIPETVRSVAEAVDWVYQNAAWQEQRNDNKRFAGTRQ